MSSGEASTSGRQPDEGADASQEELFITHQISKLDTLAGLAVRYHVTVADIKRANGLLSDSAMFAKDTLLIPTRSLPIGVEYETWAGMIVTKYGRIPGDGGRSLSFAGSSPPKQSATVDMLQRYYGTGDTASEPSDFRPGDPDDYHVPANGTEIELSELDHSGRLPPPGKGSRPPGPPGSVEYAGSRSGTLMDERLRRRRAGEDSAEISPLRGSEAEEHCVGGSPERDGGAGPSGNGRCGSGHRRAATQALGRRETILERLKRVASQPALAIPQAVSISRIGEAVIAPLAEALPPLPPGSSKPPQRDRIAHLISPRSREKEGRKAD